MTRAGGSQTQRNKMNASTPRRASHGPARDLLVIEPCLQIVSVRTFNMLSSLLAELAEPGPFPISGMRFCLPARGDVPLDRVLSEARPAAVIGLGSYANVTDDPPWLAASSRALEEGVVAAGVPLLGICFTHQWIAHHCGERVDWVEDRHRLPGRKWEGPREVRVTHPRARLLLARLEERDYGRGTGPDLAFRYVVDRTLAWDEARWKAVFAERRERLSAEEGRVRGIVEDLCADRFRCVASHAQEAKSPLGGTDLVPSATSDECAIEGFVHARAPVWTFQTHPEYIPSAPVPHEGRRVLKTFLYMAGLRIEALSGRVTT